MYPKMENGRMHNSKDTTYVQPTFRRWWRGVVLLVLLVLLGLLLLLRRQQTDIGFGQGKCNGHVGFPNTTGLGMQSTVKA